MAPASSSLQEKAALPALALQPHNSAPPCTSPAPLELRPRRWSSERASPWAGESVRGAFTGSAWGCGRPRLPRPPSPLGFTAGGDGDFCPPHWNPGRGARCGAGTPWQPGGPSQFLMVTRGCGTSPFRSPSPHLSGGGFFCVSLVEVGFEPKIAPDTLTNFLWPLGFSSTCLVVAGCHQGQTYTSNSTEKRL